MELYEILEQYGEDKYNEMINESIYEQYIIDAYSHILEFENNVFNYLDNCNILIEAAGNKETIDLNNRIKKIKNSKSQIQGEVEKEVNCTNKSAVKRSVLEKIKNRLGSDKFSVNNNRIVPAKSSNEDDEEKKKNKKFIKIIAITASAIAASIVAVILFKHLDKKSKDEMLKFKAKKEKEIDDIIKKTSDPIIKNMDNITNDMQNNIEKHKEFLNKHKADMELINNNSKPDPEFMKNFDSMMSDKNNTLIFDGKGKYGMDVKTKNGKVIPIENYISIVMDN
jgi:hypothetical protein